MVEARGGTCVHGSDYIATFESRFEATFVFNFKEEFPAFLSQRNGQSLHVVGATCGVHHLVEVAFFLEQDLLVACDTFREVVALGVGRVERCHHN